MAFHTNDCGKWLKRKPGFYTSLLTVLIFLFPLLLLLPGQVSAHASLIRAVPEPNTQMEQSPAQIELVFNERIEDKLYSIKLVDEIGRKVNTDKPELNSDHTGLLLKLPKLADGRYVVTYHVISADGHPVGESYVLTIGRNTPPSSIGTITHEHTVSLNMSPVEYFHYAGRIAYYVTLLGLIGWIAWYRILGISSNHAQAERWRGWALAWERAFLLALIFLIYTHFRDILGDEGPAGLLPLFTQTGVGLFWMESLLLAMAGFGFLLRRGWMDVAWIVLMVTVKSISGHSVAFHPAWILIPLDGIHVFAAAIWVGGLWMIVVFRKEKGFLAEVVPQFSRVAFGALAVLIISGFFTAYAFLPKLSYVLYTQWGKLLLLKTAAVLLVILLAAIIRIGLKRRGAGAVSRLVFADMGLMIIITAIVGMLTYIAPVPVNQPLVWHEMGEKVHMTTKISPNAPGNNTFVVKVWLPENVGKPKYVELWLQPNDKTDVAPIQVPIDPYDDPEIDTSYGFIRFSYKAEGPFLPFADSWKAQVRVMDSNDDETVYEHDMRLY